MPIPKLFIETYDVKCGTSPQDPQAFLVADSCMQREIADGIVALYTDLNTRKLIDQSKYGATRIFFVVVASKQQFDLPSQAFDAAALHAFLLQQGCSVPVYVKVKDDNGSNQQVLLGVCNGAQLDAIAK